MPPRPTMADVARAAGVSPTTVSHTLNGKGRVDAATRKHVHSVAESLGYVPSRVARNLALGHADTIGLLLPQLAHLPLDQLLITDWYGRIAVRASQLALSHNRALAILPALHSAQDAAAFGLEGVIVLDPIGDDPRCGVLDEAGIRYVLLGRDQRRPGIPSVNPDTKCAIVSLLDHLRAQGAQRIALLASDLDWNAGSEALEAYDEWCATRSNDVIIATAHISGCRTRDEITQEARLCARSALESRGRPDGFIGLFSDFGRAIVAAGNDLGLDVPRDLLVAQDVDDIYAQLATPPMTAIDLNIADQLAQAVALIIDPELARQTPEWVLPTTLCVRASTER